MPLNELIGNIIIVLGLLFMVFGIIGIFRFKNFYARLLVSTKIDVVGGCTFIIGIAIKHGFSFFTLKLLFLMVLILLINPIVAHFIARAAYLGGYEIDEEKS